MRIAVGLAALALALSASASFAAEPAMEMDSSMGKIYGDSKDMTLYTLTRTRWESRTASDALRGELAAFRGSR